MKTSIFKLPFKTSQLTDFPNPIIINKILTNLQEKKYQILEVSDSAVSFKQNPFRFVSRSKAIHLLDGGNFEITNTELGSLVVLNYYLNTLNIIISAAALTLFIIINGLYSSILFLGICYGIGFAFEYITTKNTGPDLLSKILSKD